MKPRVAKGLKLYPEKFAAEGGDPSQSGGKTSGWAEGDIRSSPCHYGEPHAPYLTTEEFPNF